MRNVRHTQKTITSPIGQPIEVDEQLADLLSHLWDKGYITMWSCQSGLPEVHGDIPAPANPLRYIMFYNLDHAERFQAEYGGIIDPMIYNEDRRCVRGFEIPTKEQLSLLN